MKREKLENLVTTGMNEVKQREKMKNKAKAKWLKVGRVTEVLKVPRDRDAWQVMIMYAKIKEHST